MQTYYTEGNTNIEELENKAKKLSKKYKKEYIRANKK